MDTPDAPSNESQITQDQGADPSAMAGADPSAPKTVPGSATDLGGDQPAIPPELPAEFPPPSDISAAELDIAARSLVQLRAPAPDVSSIGIDGTEYAVTDGVAHVAEHHVARLMAFGFTR